MTKCSPPEPVRAFIRHLHETLPYIEEFQGRNLVSHLKRIPAKNEFSQVFEDLVILHQLDLHVILVHGSAGEIQQLHANPESSYTKLCRSISCASWDLQSFVCRVSRSIKLLSGLFIVAAPVPDSPEEQHFLPGSVTDVNLATRQEAANTKNNNTIFWHRRKGQVIAIGSGRSGYGSRGTDARKSIGDPRQR